MIILDNECYENKTKRFLLPCLRGYGDHYTNMINSVFKLAIGINDDNLRERGPSDRNIFILVNKDFNERVYENFQEYIREHPSYVTDYCFEADMLTSKRIMFVVKVPSNFDECYDNFLEGKYSKMYNEKEIDTLFKKSTRSLEIAVLKKYPSAMPNLKAAIYREHGLNVYPEGEIIEYELPYNKREEIFNYNVD